ncbi:NAD(P)H-binding protein [Qipengyuania sp. ASV99]|uniref:NAD(P)H-binding protein n=1 Tax=Qipengyuania sp. ASV99 TaxID=3399681 RepID=UPI003A4C6B44
MSGDSSSAVAKRICVAGASGTIGSAVVHRLVADGHIVTALLRPESELSPHLSGAEIRTARLSDAAALAAILHDLRPQTVISCIASRSGSPKDALAVDYSANLNLLNAAVGAEADHFILLSAICVQRPLLAFQHAKLAFESELKSAPIEHTIVRPTAFFKSLSGQVARVARGKPFLVFGNGELTRCKPISDADLARFIADCVRRRERRGQTLPIGGPGPAITMKQQGELLFEAAGRTPQFRSVPVGMFTGAAAVLSLGARVSDWFAEKAEFARIARYYATESMLVLDPVTGEYSAEATPEFGDDRLIDHYRAMLSKAATGNNQ